MSEHYDNPSISNLTPPPMDHRYGYACELGVLDHLLELDGLNLNGLRAAWHRVRHTNDVSLATGALYDLRQRVETRTVQRLAEVTSMPESYWTDRPLTDVPDDASDLA